MQPPLPLEEAQARLLAEVTPLPIERVDVGSALGRFLSQPLVAGRTQPACDLSAMDGYAIDSSDLAGPWTVIGESAAGHPYSGQVRPGQAVRISTGAVLPDSAGTVILQENVRRTGDRVEATQAATAGRHLRRAGSDFAEGDVLAAMGQRVTPALIALALASGHRHLAVRRLPRLTVIDCGDELTDDPGDCAVHQVPASNGAMLLAQASAVPCQAARIGPVPDHAEALRNALEAASEADLIVTSGGASVGDHDIVHPVLREWGAELAFWRVAIKPGKPLLVARKGRQLVLGLPGNPVSSHVTAYLFLLPLLRALLGAAEPLPAARTALLAEPMVAGGDRREFRRGHWQGDEVVLEAVQDSGGLAALTRSNLLIDCPAGIPALPAGAAVMVFSLENGGIA